MFKLAFKDLKLFRTDKRALFFTFFMPIMLISIFAMAFGGVKEQNAKPMSILVSDLDNTSASKKLVDDIDSLKNIDVSRIGRDSGEKLVRTGEESEILILNKGFGDSMQKGSPLPIIMKYDPSKAAETGMMQQALMSNLMQMMGPGYLLNKAIKGAEQSAGPMDSASHAKMVNQVTASFMSVGQNGNPLAIDMQPVIEQKQENPGLIQAVAGTAVMMLLFGMGAMSAGLLEEKENGTLKRLLYSPMRPNSILFGKMMAAMLTALLQLTILFLFAWKFFHLEIGKNVPELIVMMVSTAFACAGFGTFIASISKSRQQADVFSRIVVLSMSAIGGSMIPIFLMPSFMQHISLISINYWSIQGFYDIYLRDVAFTDFAFLKHPLMLFGIGTGMIVLSQIFFKKNVLNLS